MSKIKYTKLLAKEYHTLYKNCKINKKKFKDIDSIVDKILKNKARYESVASSLNIPWFIVASIHNMESSQNFFRHLHNGDSLKQRTIHVPAGKPKKGEPPFTWEESATDALKLRKLHKVKKWTLSRILYEIEGYNGWGYRLYHPHVLSPYLWAYSNNYTSGKYVADGRFSDTAKSKQCGAAVIIRRLEERGEIVIHTMIDKPIFVYSNSYEEHGKELQEFLNKYDGISIRVDGWPGKKTSNAVKALFGFYLKGDLREAKR